MSYSSLGGGSSGGYSGSSSPSYGDQIYETRRRLALIDQGTRIAGMSQVDPNFAYQLAQQPIPDDELVQQTLDGQSAGQTEQMAQNFMLMPEDVRMGVWRSLTKPQQMTLQDAGIDLSVMEKQASGHGLMPFGVNLGVVGDVLAGGAAAVDFATNPLQSAGSDALHYLTVAGDTMAHAWRSTSDLQDDEEFSRERLLDAQLRSQIQTENDTEYTDDQWRQLSRPFWQQEAEGDGAFASSGTVAEWQQQNFVDPIAPAGGDPNLEQQIIEAGDELKSSAEYKSGFIGRWNRTATGEQYIPPSAQIEVLDQFGGDWDKMNLAVEIASGTALEELAGQAADPGTPEYANEWLRLNDLVQGDEMQQAVTELSGSKVTIGRSIASGIGLNETAPGDIDSWYGALSGGIDAAVTVFADPTIVGGKIRHGYHSLAVVAENVDDVARLTDASRAVAVADGLVEQGAVRFTDPNMIERFHQMLRSPNPMVQGWWRGQRRIARRNWRSAESIAAHFRGEGPQGMDFFVRNPGLRRNYEQLARAHLDDAHDMTSADGVLRYFESKQGYETLLNGQLGRWTHSGTELPQQTSLQRRGFTARAGARKWLDDIHDAEVAKKRTRRTGADPATQEHIEQLTGEHPTWSRRISGAAVNTPVVGRLTTGTQKTLDALSTHLPYREGLHMAGPGSTDEAYKAFMLSRFGEMTTAEANRHFEQFIAGLTDVDDITVMSDMLRRSGFDDAAVNSLVYKGKENGIGQTLDELAEFAEDDQAYANLQRLKGLATAGSGVNVENRRNIMANFFDEVFRDSGVYRDDEGRKWASRWADGLRSQRYGIDGHDTVVIDGRERAVGILPTGDWSSATAQLDMPGFINHTQKGNLLRRMWTVGHNQYVDGFMQFYWKPAMLLRLGFIPRAAGEELLSFVLRDGASNYFKMQRALIAERGEEEVLAPLRLATRIAGVPGRMQRRVMTNTVKTRNALLEKARAEVTGPMGRYNIDQGMDHLKSLEAQVQVQDDIRDSVSRMWHDAAVARESGTPLERNMFAATAYLSAERGRFYSSDWMNRMRDRALPYTRTWVNKATREMRVAEMGPIDLISHYLAGEVSRRVRGAARWGLSDELLTSARHMLYDRNVAKAYTEMISGSGMLMNFADHRGAESTTINILNDAAGRPILNLKLKTPPGGSQFEEVSMIGPDLGSNLSQTFRFKNELERVHRDLVVRNHVTPVMRGWVAPGQMRNFQLHAMGTAFEVKGRNLYRREAAEVRQAQSQLGYLSKDIDAIFTPDGQLTDEFVDRYEDLQASTRLGISAGDEGADEANKQLSLMGSEVLARRGVFDNHLVGEIDDAQMVRLVAYLKRHPEATAQDQFILNEVGRKWGQGPRGANGWGDMDARDGQLGQMDATAQAGDEEGRAVAGRINDRAAGTEMTDAQTFIDRMVDQSGQGQFVYRVVSEEDWQRIKANGVLDTDGRANVEGGTELQASTQPDLTYATTNPEGSRLLRIEVREGDGWADPATLGEDAPFTEAGVMLNSNLEGVPIDRVSASPPFVVDGQSAEELGGLPEAIRPDAPIRVLPDEGGVPPQPTAAVPGVPETEVAGEGVEEALEPAQALDDPEALHSTELPPEMLEPGEPPQLDVDQAGRIGASVKLTAETRGTPVSIQDAWETENLDRQFQEIADRLMPGWDNEASDSSRFFRDRSDEVTPGPRTDVDFTPESYLHEIEKLRKYVSGLPKEMRERIRRIAMGDHNLPSGQRARANWRDEAEAVLLETGQEYLDSAHLLELMKELPGDTRTRVNEVVEMLYELDPSIAYLVADDSIPLWTSSYDDLKVRMTAAARRGIHDPDVLPMSREMSFFTTTKDGRRVAQPLPEGQRRFVTIMGDRELLTALEGVAVNREAAFGILRRKGLLDDETEAFFNSFLDNLMPDDALAAFARSSSSVGDAPMAALSSVGTEDFDTMARVNDMLPEIIRPEDLPPGPRQRNLGYVDVADQRVGNFGLTWQTDDLGNGATRLDDGLIGNSRHYDSQQGQVRYGQTMVNGVEPDEPIQQWAETITDYVLKMMGTPNEALNHHIIEPLHRGELGLETLRETPPDMLPRSFTAPVLVEDSSNAVSALVRKGFDSVISPAIDSIVREPMFLSAYHRSRMAVQPLTDRLRDESLVSAVNQLAEDSHLTRNADDVQALLKDIPNEFFDDGTSSLTRSGLVKRLMEQGTEDLDKTARFIDELTDDGFATIKKWARQEEHIEHWGRAKAINLGVDGVMPFIDDTNIRSYFQEYVKNLMPFYFAQEQFIRRWARTIAQSPESIRKAQLMYQGIEDTGFIQTDEYGNDYFMYPLPDAASQWLANTPVLEHMFGGGGAVPNVLEFTGQVSYALPGLDDPFGVPSLGPLGAIPMGFLANHFPELEPLEETLLTQRGIDRDLTEQLVPSWAVQTYRAVVNDPKFTEQLNSTTIRAMAALEARGSELRLDAEEALAAGNEERSLELQEEANKYSLRDGANPREVEEWIDSVKAYSRRMLMFKGLFANVAPASPQLVDTATLRPEFQELLQNLPFEEAVQTFLTEHPEGLPFTISGTNNESMANVPATEATHQWLQDHGELVDRYRLAGPWLIPASDATDQFNRKAWTDMQAAGIRSRKTPEEWYDDLKFAAGAGVYFESQENYERAILQAGEDSEAKANVQLQWDSWRTAYLSQHPLFASQLNGESTSRKQEVFDELALALRDPDIEASPQIDSMRMLVTSYENFARQLSLYTGDQRAEGEAMRAALRNGLYVWAQQFLIDHPEVNNLWHSIVEPLAGLRGYGSQLAITGTTARAEGVTEQGSQVAPGEPTAL